MLTIFGENGILGVSLFSYLAREEWKCVPLSISKISGLEGRREYLMELNFLM
jgi:hypothetical protein